MLEFIIGSILLVLGLSHAILIYAYKTDPLQTTDLIGHMITGTSQKKQAISFAILALVGLAVHPVFFILSPAVNYAYEEIVVKGLNVD